MLVFNSINIAPYSRNAFSITWDFDVSADDTISLYSLNIYRSECQEGPFDFVYSPSVTVNSYIDPTVNTLSKNRFYFYKVRATALDDSTSYESDIESVQSTPDLIALDILRRERLLLKRYIKTKCYFYLARTFGVRCLNCWDDIKQRRTRSKCNVCYGTGFERGFFDPIPGYINIDPSALVVQPSNIGPIQKSECSAFTTNYPWLKVADYVFEVETGKRWSITQIGYNEKTRFVTKQLLRLSQESRGSIIQDIQLPSIWTEPW